MSGDDLQRTPIEERLADSGEIVAFRVEEEAEGEAGGWRGVGFLRARKQLQVVRVDDSVERRGEELDVQRLAAADDDAGGVLTLPDGGVSIPIYEEQLVVTKQVVLKERLVVRKRVVTTRVPVEAELRRERVDIDVDEEIRDRVVLPDEQSNNDDNERSNK